MKLCIPIKENKGLDSVAFNHFGSSPIFMIYDTATEETKLIENGNLHHEHGMCQPLKALGGEKVDAVLVAGIGAGALSKLAIQGVKAYRVEEGTVAYNIELFNKNALPEFTLEHSCKSHDCGH